VPNSFTSSRLLDLERAERIGQCWSYPQGRTFADLLIDCEEDRTLRASGSAPYRLTTGSTLSHLAHTP
jgi:hypothetical protein